MQIRRNSPSARRASIAFASFLIAAMTLGWSALSPAGVSSPGKGRWTGIGEDGVRLGFEVTAPDFSEVGHPIYVLFFDGCSAVTSSPESDVIDNKGRYRVDGTQATSETSLRGQFLSSKRAQGRLRYEQFNPMICDGTYKYDYAATRIASISTRGGGVAKPLNGRYAGGGKDVYLWLDVRQGVVSDVGFNGEFSNCTANVAVGDDDGPPDPDGTWSIQEVDPPNDFFVRGRFKSKSRVKGRIIWSSTAGCPTPSADFAFRAQRLKVPG